MPLALQTFIFTQHTEIAGDIVDLGMGTRVDYRVENLPDYCELRLQHRHQDLHGQQSSSEIGAVGLAGKQGYLEKCVTQSEAEAQQVPMRY